MENDPRPTTCQNLRYLRKVTNLENAEQFSSWRIREELPKKTVPEAEKWRLGLLTKLMAMKQNQYMEVQDSKRITAMVESLCSTSIAEPFLLHLRVTPAVMVEIVVSYFFTLGTS